MNEWIKLPSVTGEEVSISDDSGLIAFASIDQDMESENPLDSNDGLGMIYSFSPKHQHSLNLNLHKALVEQFGDDVIPLSYFEHGNCIWAPLGELNSSPDFRWDGVCNAGIWAPDQSVLDSYLPAIYAIAGENKYNSLPDDEKKSLRHSWMKEQARSACKTYTQFCNGEVFGHEIVIYKIRKADNGHIFNKKDDYRFDTPVVEESCYELYGWDYAHCEFQEFIDGLNCTVS